jgi:hypothetical protein
LFLVLREIVALTDDSAEALLVILADTEQFVLFRTFLARM